jgi:chromosome segregation ATPase
MDDPEAYTFPNSHNAHMGEMMSPLVPDRVCELSVECCFLRNDISDKSHQNDQLQSTINRMKTAVKRGSSTLKSSVELNKSLESEKTQLVTELMTAQKKLMKAESKVSFQSKIIENNRKVIARLKAPTDESNGKVSKNVAQVMKESLDLRVEVERLTADLQAKTEESQEKQVSFLVITSCDLTASVVS